MVTMIGNAPQHSDSASSVWESLGQLCIELVEVKGQVKEGFKEMDDLNKMEKDTSSDLVLDLTIPCFDNLANSYTENFKAIKDKPAVLE
jgi:hypothetical protein